MLWSLRAIGMVALFVLTVVAAVTVAVVKGCAQGAGR